MAGLSPFEQGLHRQIQALNQILESTEGLLLDAVAACPHPLSVRETENKASTGNYDPTADSYWADHRCKLCDKSWQTDQNWQSRGGEGMPPAKGEG